MSKMRLLLIFVVLPFGYTLGLAIALVFAGDDFGQLPLMTVPIGIVAAIVFAFWPFRTEQSRFVIMLVGTVVGAVLCGVLIRMHFPGLIFASKQMARQTAQHLPPANPGPSGDTVSSGQPPASKPAQEQKTPQSASAKEAPSSVAAFDPCASASKPAQGQNLPAPLLGRLTSTSGVHHVAIRSASCVEVRPGMYQVELTGDASGPAPFFLSAASSPNNGVGSGATWCASWSCSASADGVRNQNTCKHNPGEPATTYWSSKNLFQSQTKEPPDSGYAIAYEAMPDGNTFVERAGHRVALVCGR